MTINENCSKVRLMSENEKHFTATEVGTLIESFRSDLSIVSERVGTLCEDMDEVKHRLSSLEVDVRSIKDVMQISVLPCIARLEKKVGF